MDTIHNCPTDPLEVLCTQAVRNIRKWVADSHARISEWEPRPMPEHYATSGR